MEGPSLYIAAQQLQPFVGKKVLSVEGNTKEPKDIFINKKVVEIYAWGKHLVFQFNDVALRIHFMLFGTYIAMIDGQKFSGDYKRTNETTLTLTFANGDMKIYNSVLKITQTSNLKATYDFSIDIMSEKWDGKAAQLQVQKKLNQEIADVLLDQKLFAGVGNAIKNEVLSLVKVNPKTLVADLHQDQIQDIVSVTRKFSQQFYTWKVKDELKKHLKIHRQDHCPYCGGPVKKEVTGKQKRNAFYCPNCQPLIFHHDKHDSHQSGLW